MEQVAVSGGNGQPPSDHKGFADLLYRLSLSAPPRSTVVKVSGNGVPVVVGQGRCALLSGLEVPWVTGTGQIRQGFGSGTQGEPCGGRGARRAVAGGFEH